MKMFSFGVHGSMVLIEDSLDVPVISIISSNGSFMRIIVWVSVYDNIHILNYFSCSLFMQ